MCVAYMIFRATLGKSIAVVKREKAQKKQKSCDSI